MHPNLWLCCQKQQHVPHLSHKLAITKSNGINWKKLLKIETIVAADKINNYFCLEVNYSCGHQFYDIQSNLAISNSVNSKSPLFQRKIECPWIYPSRLCFAGYFEAPLFRTFFHFPWDFEIAGFNCTVKICVLIILVYVSFFCCLYILWKAHGDKTKLELII